MEYAFIGTETEAGWSEWTGSNVETSEAGVRLATAPTFLPPAVVADLPDVTVVDVDRDGCGDLYVLGRSDTDSRSILYRIDRATGALRRLSCLGTDEAPVEEASGTDEADGSGWEPTALRLTTDTVYLAERRTGDRPSGRVRALSRWLLQTRWVADDSLTAPVALAEHGGTVYVLDAGDDPAVAAVRPDGGVERVVGGFVAPTDLSADDAGNLYVLDAASEGGDGLLVRRFAADALESDGEPVTAGEAPTATLPDGTTCIEAADSPLVDGRRAGEGESVEGTADGVPPDATTDADAGGESGASAETELFACAGPDAFGETSLFRLAFAGDAIENGEQERVVRFSDRCARLLWRPGRERSLYGIDRGASTVYFLKATRRNRATGGRLAHDARLVRRFDSGLVGVQWHRLTLDRDVGEGDTRIRVSYYATDDPGEELERLEAISGIGERFADRLRAAGVAGISDLADLSAEEVADIVSTHPGMAGLVHSNARRWLERAREWTPRWRPLDGADPQDALLTDATGRYLWVKLELLGSETASPRVASLRAYFPRRSYLRYLPAVYSEDERSAAFLERFLSLFESVFTDVEAGIESVTTYLDPDGVPAEHVPWLGEWLGLDIDETWSEAAARELVASAPVLFTKRGTPAGLLETLGIYLRDVEVAAPSWERARERERETLAALVEAGLLTDAEMDEALADHAALAAERHDDRLFSLLESTDLDRIDSEAAAVDYRRLVGSQHRFVVLVRSAVGDERVRTVRRIIETQTPTHASGRAVELRPRFEVGGHTYLNVNSVLSTPRFVVGEAGLGKDATLTEREQYAQFGVKSRLGEDTLMS